MALEDDSRRQASYLGDGVYVANDGYQLWVRANNADWHKFSTADVAIEPRTLVGLVAYARIAGLVGPEKI